MTKCRCEALEYIGREVLLLLLGAIEHRARLVTLKHEVDILLLSTHRTRTISAARFLTGSQESNVSSGTSSYALCLAKLSISLKLLSSNSFLSVPLIA